MICLNYASSHKKTDDQCSIWSTAIRGSESSLVAVDAARRLVATIAAKQWGEKLQSFSVGIHVCSLI
jgi:hypothetical protein